MNILQDTLEEIKGLSRYYLLNQLHNVKLTSNLL